MFKFLYYQYHQIDIKDLSLQIVYYNNSNITIRGNESLIKSLPEQKIHGIIKSSLENLGSSIFEIRPNISTANNDSYGIACVKSSINLYGVSFGIREYFSNNPTKTYYPSTIGDFITNQEKAIDLINMQSDDGILTTISLENITGRTQPDRIVDY